MIFPVTGITAAELGVVINVADAQSVAVGAAYVAARNIPAANVVEVDIPTTDVISADAFAPAKALVDALPATVQALALTFVNPYRVDCMSVTTAFGIAYDAARFCSTPCSATESQPTYNSASHTPFSDYGIRPTMMIAATSFENAEALIATGVAADDTFPTGDGYLMRTTDSARSVRWGGYPGMVTAWDRPGGVHVTYLDNSANQLGSDVVSNTTNILFYFQGLSSVAELATNTYLPGAVADHLTSYGGQVPSSGQMSALRFLEAGVTASYGTVVEPCNYNGKFPDPAVWLRHYFHGEPVIEAYWKSVSMPGEGLFIGEPLARPYGRNDVAWEPTTRTLTLTTNLLEAGVTYVVEGANDRAGPWTELLRTSIAQDARTAIVVDDVTTAAVRLRRADSI